MVMTMLNRSRFNALILNIFFLVLFAVIVSNVQSNGLAVEIDRWVNAKIHLLYSPFLIGLMKLISDIISPFSLSILSLIILAILIALKKWRELLLLVFSLAAGVFLSDIIKIITHRPRPLNPLIEADDYSFPSRHAVLSIIFFSLLIYFFKDKIKNKLLKKLFIAANVFIFLAVGLSRVYLNVHWLSDIIAGFALGLFILTLFILIFRLAKTKEKALCDSRNFTKIT